MNPILSFITILIAMSTFSIYGGLKLVKYFADREDPNAYKNLEYGILLILSGIGLSISFFFMSSWFRGKMASIADLEEPIVRFLSRKEFEEIKNRFQRLPRGEYSLNNQTQEIYCSYVDSKLNLTNKHIVNLVYPGLKEFFINLQSDMEKLILHVQEADKENDYLLSKLRAKEENEQTTGDR